MTRTIEDEPKNKNKQNKHRPGKNQDPRNPVISKNKAEELKKKLGLK